jgi:aryl-alcohol dehydrogenase-like predicted oxidoreductase
VRLALGTAQFGMSYGIASATGRMPLDACGEILALARASGVDTLDTAIAYGEAEAVLGRIGVDNMRVITKLPALPDDVADVEGWVHRMITGSLMRLGIASLDSVLLHRPGQLLERRGQLLHDALAGLKAEGITRRVGVSIYAPDELDAILPRFQLDLVQAPFNVFDRRLERSGWLQRLSAAGVEVHVRSVFLQGLLLMKHAPHGFERWAPLWRRWSEWIEASSVTRVRACLQFALGQPDVQRVVVGVDSAEHFQQILAAADAPCTLPPDNLSTGDVDLIDPSRWRVAARITEGTGAVVQAR